MKKTSVETKTYTQQMIAELFPKKSSSAESGFI